MTRTALAQSAEAVKPCAQNVRRHLKEAGLEALEARISSVTSGSKQTVVRFHKTNDVDVAHAATALQELWQDGAERVSHFGSSIHISQRGWYGTVPAAAYVRPTESHGHPVLARVYRVLAEQNVDITSFDFYAEGEAALIRNRVTGRLALAMEDALNDGTMLTMGEDGKTRVIFRRVYDMVEAEEQAYATQAEREDFARHAERMEQELKVMGHTDFSTYALIAIKAANEPDTYVADQDIAWEYARLQNAERTATAREYAGADLDELEIAAQTLSEALAGQELAWEQRVGFEARHAVISRLLQAARDAEAERIAEASTIALREEMDEHANDAARWMGKIEAHREDVRYWYRRGGKVGRRNQEASLEQVAAAEAEHGRVQAKLNAILDELARRDAEDAAIIADDQGDLAELSELLDDAAERDVVEQAEQVGQARRKPRYAREQLLHYRDANQHVVRKYVEVVQVSQDRASGVVMYTVRVYGTSIEFYAAEDELSLDPYFRSPGL